MLNPPIVLAIPHLIPNKVCSIPRGIALRLRRICDDDEILEKRSSQYQNYFIARYHKPPIVKKQFSEVKKKTNKIYGLQKQTKQDKVCGCNPVLPNIHNVIQNNLSILHTGENMKKISPPKSIKTSYKREKNLKEILSVS